MTQKERMLAGQLYVAQDPELGKDNTKARNLTRLFNQTTEHEPAYRTQLLKKLFGKTGEKLYIEPPFRCDYGCQITIGENFYANYDCLIIDVCPVVIGDNVFFGPRVCIYTAGHPIDALVRNALVEFGKPVTIGHNVWVGGNAILNPGVNIGNNVVIGSGSVVTRDIPDDVIAVGNPCKVLRAIDEGDKQYWEEKLRDYINTNYDWPH